MNTEEKTVEASAFFAVRSGGKGSVVDIPIGRHRLAGTGDAVVRTAESVAHAVVTWDGIRVVLESMIGDPELVYVAGRRVEDSVELRPGDEVALGSLHLVLGIASPDMSTARRALLHPEFSERLAEELARAARGGRPVSLAFVRTRPSDGARLLRAALARFRAGDVVATYAPDEVELLLPDTPRERAELVVSRLIEAAQITDTRQGIVVAPEDAAHPEALVRLARIALRNNAFEPERIGIEAPVAVDSETQDFIQGLSANWHARALYIRGELGTGKSTLVAHIHRLQSGGEPFGSISCAAARSPDELLETAARGPVGTLLVRDLDAWPLSERAAFVSRLLRAGLPARRIILSENTTTAGSAREPHGYGITELTLSPLRKASRRYPASCGALCSRLETDTSLSFTWRARTAAEPSMAGETSLELENAIERAVRLATSGEILAEHLPGDPVRAPTEGRLKEHVDSLERDAITKALAEANHNQTRAAQLLGLSRRALIYKMEKYGLKGPAGTLRKR